MTLSSAQKKILVFLLLALTINCLYSALSASVSATVNSRRQVLQDYLRCEARGTHAECDVNEIVNVLQTSRGLLLTDIVCMALFPVILLPFIVNVKELKKSCKHIYSLLRACCVSKKQLLFCTDGYTYVVTTLETQCIAYILYFLDVCTGDTILPPDPTCCARLSRNCVELLSLLTLPYITLPCLYLNSTSSVPSFPLNDLPVLATCLSGTLVMLSRKVNCPVAYGST